MLILPGRRYFKSVYELVREAAYFLGKNGRVFSDNDVIQYIQNKYPDCPYSENSFRMHLLGLSLNNKHAPTRWPNLYRRAFLIQVKSNRFRLAEMQENNMEVEEGGGTPSGTESEEFYEISYSLSLERDLEDYLSRNLSVIEEGLKLEERQKELPGVGRLDILAKDKEGNTVVIELKAGPADERAVAQILAYMQFLREQGYENVRGILIASMYTSKAVYAAKAISNLRLAKYEVEFKISYL